MILAIPSCFSRWRTSAFLVSQLARLVLEDLPAGLQCSAAKIVIVLFFINHFVSFSSGINWVTPG